MLIPNREQLFEAVRSKIYVVNKDNTPPNRENKNAVTLPISNETSITRQNKIKNACRIVKQDKANSVTTFANPNFMPGIGIIASKGNNLSTRDNTIANAVNKPHCVMELLFL